MMFWEIALYGLIIFTAYACGYFEGKRDERARIEAFKLHPAGKGLKR